MYFVCLHLFEVGQEGVLSAGISLQFVLSAQDMSKLFQMQ